MASFAISLVTVRLTVNVVVHVTMAATVIAGLLKFETWVHAPAMVTA